MILYMDNPKVATRKLLQLINEFDKVAAYKINTHKSLHLYILTIQNLKEKLKTQSHLPSHQKE